MRVFRCCAGSYEADRVAIDCYLLPFLILRVTLAYLTYMSMSCLTQERGRRTILMKRRRLGFGRWALNARNVVYSV
jgi:hypothetical protein